MIQMTKIQKHHGDNSMMSIVPKKLCDSLGIKKGDHLVWKWDDDEGIVALSIIKK